MPDPIIIFDHIQKVVAVTGSDPSADQKLVETVGQSLASSAGAGQPPER